MPRRKEIDHKGLISIRFPDSLRGELTLHLWSELDGRVPYGTWSTFFIERAREYLSNVRLDLAPYAGTEPGVFVVSGSDLAIAELKKLLEGAQ